jgi:hypothetical protein
VSGRMSGCFPWCQGVGECEELEACQGPTYGKAGQVTLQEAGHLPRVPGPPGHPPASVDNLSAGNCQYSILSHLYDYVKSRQAGRLSDFKWDHHEPAELWASAVCADQSQPGLGRSTNGRPANISAAWAVH